MYKRIAIGSLLVFLLALPSMGQHPDPNRFPNGLNDALPDSRTEPMFKLPVLDPTKYSLFFDDFMHNTFAGTVGVATPYIVGVTHGDSSAGSRHVFRIMDATAGTVRLQVPGNGAATNTVFMQTPRWFSTSSTTAGAPTGTRRLWYEVSARFGINSTTNQLLDRGNAVSLFMGLINDGTKFPQELLLRGYGSFPSVEEAEPRLIGQAIGFVKPGTGTSMDFISMHDSRVAKLPRIATFCSPSRYESFIDSSTASNRSEYLKEGLNWHKYSFFYDPNPRMPLKKLMVWVDDVLMAATDVVFVPTAPLAAAFGINNITMSAVAQPTFIEVDYHLVVQDRVSEQKYRGMENPAGVEDHN